MPSEFQEDHRIFYLGHHKTIGAWLLMTKWTLSVKCNETRCAKLESGRQQLQVEISLADDNDEHDQ